MNKVILVGRLTRDPELRSTTSGFNTANFSVAVQRNFKNKDGNFDADFINCVAFRNQADFISKYFKKGNMIGLEGRIQSRSYDANDGTKRYVTEVLVDNVEFVGSKSPLAEVELISLITTLISKIGLKDAKLHINSIGCACCRKTYNDALLTFLKKHEDKLCPTCKERMEKNPLRVIDCKVTECKEIVAEAPRTIEYLDEECKEHFEELQALLNELQIPYEIDTGIVRGLDYYTKLYLNLCLKTSAHKELFVVVVDTTV